MPDVSLTATSLYAGLLGLFLVLISANVVRQRFVSKVSVGDGDDHRLYKRMRVQANFTEYAPMGLILLGLAEVQGAPIWVVHGLGIMLVVGRVLHAYGYGKTPQIVWMRQFGMVLTFAMLSLTALAVLGHAVL